MTSNYGTCVDCNGNVYMPMGVSPEGEIRCGACSKKFKDNQEKAKTDGTFWNILRLSGLLD